MKHQVFLMLVISSVFINWKQSGNKLLGEWRGVDNAGKAATIIFDTTGHCSLVMDNQTIVGKEYMIHGHKCELKYQIDYTHTPYWIDLNCYTVGRIQPIFTIKGICELISDKKMELRTAEPNKERPIVFGSTKNDDDSTIILDKVQ